jgi:hypothetical protein
MTNAVSSYNACGQGVVGSLSNRLVGPSSFFDGRIKGFHELLKTFRRIWLEPQRLFRFWLVSIVPVFIDLRVLFAKLNQPFIQSGVPYTWSGLGVHDYS